MKKPKQFRFCPECGFSKRDDNFDIDFRNSEKDNICPKCDYWLWSIIFDEENYITILDWDENEISGFPKTLKSLFEFTILKIDKIGESQ